MKKFLLLFSILWGVTFNGLAQLRINGYFDGYWGTWSTVPSANVYGNYEGFVIYAVKDGPWNYRFKFSIDKFKVPPKKQRKKDMKEDKFYVFTGTVEYYISDDFPSALSAFRHNKGPKFIEAKLKNGRPTKKIISKAIIRVAAFKDVPTTYNIWYDGVGLAINLNTIRFSHKVKYE